MINELRLQNYRQHENRTVQFGPGINAIRAANGMGKSKMLEAITYCLFGARALPAPLENVVTRGAAVGKLKAEVDITHQGVDYTFSRGKSGAEVLTSGKVLVTGANEVTKFAEQLFGANAEMASKLMFAKQKQLGGALSGGAAKASEMIEFLADFDLFDRIIGLIQTKLPNGATTSVEGRIGLLRAQAGEVVLADLAPLKSALEVALAAWNGAKGNVTTLAAQLDNLDVAAALSILAQQKQLTANITGRTNAIGALRAALAAPALEAPPAGALDAVRAKIEAQKKLEAASKIHAQLPAIEVLWDEPRAALDAAVKESAEAVYALEKSVVNTQAAITENKSVSSNGCSARRIEIIRLEGQLIKESTCAFCQKDLTDVPEVVQINTSVGADLARLRTDLTEFEITQLAALKVLQDQLADRNKQVASERAVLGQLQDVVKADNALQPIYARAADYITLDTSVVPSKWTWTGPTDAPQDFAGELATLEAQDRAATADVARRAQQFIQKEQQEAAQLADEATLAGLPIKDAEETLQLADGLKPQVAAARAALEVAADAAHLAEAALKTAQMANENTVLNQTNAQAQLKASEAEIVEMQENNALIKKVRAAKPQVIDQLWAMALAATSRYGSQMRGEQWVVSRADGEFLVNGFPAIDLSGAEEDLLGLSIRVALTKLFLPSTPFMVLDEVAAACDDQRETAMLGLLSTLDFDQIILVTHSELADSYANNIITL